MACVPLARLPYAWWEAPAQPGYTNKRALAAPQYDVEQLAERGDFNDSAYLLLHGELPTPEQKALFDRELTTHSLVHEQLIMCARSFAHTIPTVTRVTCIFNGLCIASCCTAVFCTYRYGLCQPAEAAQAPCVHAAGRSHCLA